MFEESRCQNCTAEQTVDSRVSHVKEEIIEVVKAEIIEVVKKDIIDVVKHIKQVRTYGRTLEHAVEVPVPGFLEKTGEVFQLVVQDRISDRVGEQTVGVSKKCLDMFDEIAEKKDDHKKFYSLTSARSLGSMKIPQTEPRLLNC